MCGIAGAISTRERAAERVVKQMLETLDHRGPDAEGAFGNGILALGHKRLKILDLSDDASQPMSIDHDRFVIAYNGEVYNHLDIRAEIGRDDPWRSSSDTETVLRAYAKWGIDCVDRLNGMFAFALWDDGDRSLYLVRDRFGVKPLYYAMVDGTLFFASEIKGFFGSGIPIEPNYHAIGDFLRWGVIEHSDATWFEGIHAVPPGHHLRWKNGEINLERYYHLPDHVDEDAPIEESATIETATELLVDSIVRTTQSDRKVGVHFSGGIDSSIVAAKVSQHFGGDLETYTYGYNEEAYSEFPYARRVADLLKVENHQSTLSHDDLAQTLIRTLREQDEPFTSIRIVSEHKLYADFKDDGATVILEAAGGDEIAAGYSGYLWPWYLDAIKDVGPMQARSNLLSVAGQTSEKNDLMSFFLGSAANSVQPGQCTSDGIPFLEPKMLDADFSNRNSRPPEFDRPFRSHLRNSQYIDFHHIKLPRFLRYLDRASMASSREARVPLLDHRIAELGFATANSSKINENHQRYFMKKAAINLLPSGYMPNKRSVVDPQRDWAQEGWLADRMTDVFNSKAFNDRGLYNHKVVSGIFENYRKADVATNSFGFFQLFMTELWFENIIEGNHGSD